MKEKNPNQLDEVKGGLGAGLKRGAQRTAAAFGQAFLGQQTDIEAQDERARLANEFIRYIKNIEHGGTKVSITYANLMSYLRQAHDYVPDQLAQSQIMQFMKTAGRQRLQQTPDESKKILQTVTKDKRAPEVAKAARIVDTNPSKEAWANFRNLAARLGADYNIDGKRIEKAYLAYLKSLKNKPGQPQQPQQQNAQPSDAGAGGVQQGPNDADQQAQHPNNQGNHPPIQETFEDMARRLLGRDDDFEFAAAALILEADAQNQDLYQRAVAAVGRAQAGEGVSTNYLRKTLDVSYEQAAALIQQLEQNGVVSAPDSNQLRKVLRTTNQGNASPIDQGEQNGEGVIADQETEAQARQAAEAPGANGAAPKAGAGADPSKYWVDTIEPGIPNKNAPLNRSQLDKLLSIVASDRVRRGLTHNGGHDGGGSHGGGPRGGGQRGGGQRGGGQRGGGGSMVSTSSGSKFDMHSFEQKLVEAGIKGEQIDNLLKITKNHNVKDAEGMLFRYKEMMPVAAAIAVAFAQSYYPSSNQGH